MRSTPELSTATWRKSSYSNMDGGACVEINDAIPDVIAVRDSKDPEGPRLAFGRDAWSSFVAFAAEQRV